MDRVVEANGINLWSEGFGDPGDPAVLLLSGLNAQGISWPAAFCERLAAAGFHPIRFDNRDTGRSDRIDFEVSPYTFGDLADDAAGLLTALGIGRAHLIGSSMGGMVAQEVVLRHPDRVLSLTMVMSTSAVPDPATGVWPAGLPAQRDEVLAWMVEDAMNPPADDGERLERSVGLFRILTGSAHPFDEGALRARLAEERGRAADAGTSTNHASAFAASRDRTGLVSAIAVPTLVVHGDEDPILPIEHARFTAEHISGSTLKVLPGVGHELPDALLDEVADAVIAHLRSVEGA